MDNGAEFFDDIFANKEPELSDFQTDCERVEYLIKLLINRCTNDGIANCDHYKALRKYFMANSVLKEKLPRWVQTCYDLDYFWQFIKPKLGTYAERRKFIRDEFISLLNYIESFEANQHFETIQETLKCLNSEYIMLTWEKAITRKDTDPEGAITTSRTLLESVLKHILDDMQFPYSNNIDMHELYKLVAKELKLCSEQHVENIFKQILGGCSAVVNGLANLRNRLGDAHGKGRISYQPADRHAELAVNLSGSICLFLLQTYEWTKKQKCNK